MGRALDPFLRAMAELKWPPNLGQLLKWGPVQKNGLPMTETKSAGSSTRAQGQVWFGGASWHEDHPLNRPRARCPSPAGWPMETRLPRPGSNAALGQALAPTGVFGECAWVHAPPLLRRPQAGAVLGALRTPGQAQTGVAPHAPDAPHALHATGRDGIGAEQAARPPHKV